MKKCRYCGEDIQSDAVKCRYCNEFQDWRSRLFATVGSPRFLIALLVIGSASVLIAAPKIERVLRSCRVVSVSVRFEPSSASLGGSEARALEGASTVIRRRLHEMGGGRFEIVSRGVDELVVSVQGGVDADQLEAMVKSPGRLELRPVDDSLKAQEALARLAAGASEEAVLPAGDALVRDGEGTPYLVMAREAELGGHVVRSDVHADAEGATRLSVQCDAAGSRLLSSVTERNVKKRLAIISDGVVLAAPRISQKISGGSAIIGNLDPDTARQLSIVLVGGELPLKVKDVRELPQRMAWSRLID